MPRGQPGMKEDPKKKEVPPKRGPAVKPALVPQAQPVQPDLPRKPKFTRTGPVYG